MYHSIVKSKEDMGNHNIYVTVKDFQKQLKYLKENNYTTLTFRDINADYPTDFHKKVIITFDDGYEDNYYLAFPILKQYGFKAVIFLVTKLQYNKWGVAEGEPLKQLLSPDQLLEMDDYGIEFGGHTQTHRSLIGITGTARETEIAGCKNDIEKILHKEVISFAYPFGAMDESTKQLVEKAGFKYGIATKKGSVEFAEDLYQIRRIEISKRTTIIGFKIKASGYYLTKKYLLF